MLKRRSNSYGRARDTSNTAPSSTSRDEEVAWEMRPGGMLVQKRGENSDAPAPNLRLRIAFGAMRYEISAASQSTFGELKKVLTAETGLQPGEQRLIFRGKERENVEYLDMCGVKDRSKVLLIEDPASIERRADEMRRNAKIQSAHRAISDVSVEVDKLAEQVSAIEKSISNGVKVAEVQITTLIEMLMRQAIKLDNISADGDAVAQKTLQGEKKEDAVKLCVLLAACCLWCCGCFLFVAFHQTPSGQFSGVKFLASYGRFWVCRGQLTPLAPMWIRHWLEAWSW